MKKPAQHLIAEVSRRRAKVEITIGIDLGDVWSHYCTLNHDGEVVDAEKLARYGRLDPNILRPIAHRTVQQQEALTLVCARALLPGPAAAAKPVRRPRSS